MYGPAVRDVFVSALRLGLTSFGGPIAHIGYFREEYVERRRWFDEREFGDLLALCQSLPGPAIGANFVYNKADLVWNSGSADRATGISSFDRTHVLNLAAAYDQWAARCGVIPWEQIAPHRPVPATAAHRGRPRGRAPRRSGRPARDRRS